MSAQARAVCITPTPARLGFAGLLAAVALAAASAPALATGTFGTRVDTQCASLAPAPNPPQQSRPYLASGNRCSLCHTSAAPSRNDLNALGIASRTGGTAINPFCVNTAPNGVSITAPPAGTTVTQGQSVTFTGGATDPDGFPLTFSWTFSNGLPSATGQSVTVPMTATGTVTATLSVRDPNGAPGNATPTRSVSVTASTANQAPNGTIQSPATDQTVPVGTTIAFQGTGLDPDNNLPLAFLWTFGGAAADSTAQNPSVTFSTAGTFQVRLTVTDVRGLADPSPATRVITVTQVGTAACPDTDGDGYSPAGGICGPIDCNDRDPNIHPGAKESCGDGIDNDCDGRIDGNDSECNGTDCIGALAARPVVISSATWESGDRELEVKGIQGTAGATVTVRSATGRLLGTTVVRSDGSWEFELAGISVVPCRVRVEIGTAFAERAVANAPANCESASPPPAAQADAYTTPAGTRLTVAAPGVLANDTSPSGRPLSALLVTNAARGSVSLAANGGFTYTPASGFVGTDSFTYRVSDGVANSAAATVTLTVTAVTQTLTVSRAEWDDGRLRVEGSQAPARATVTIRNGSTGAVVGTTTSDASGRFRFDRSVSAVPCSVRVESNGRVGTRAVEDAPSNCAR